VSWFDWDLQDWQRDLLETTRFLAGLRAGHPALRQRMFFSGNQVREDGSTDLGWFDAAGRPMTAQAWADPASRTVSMLLDGADLGEDSMLVLCHGGAHMLEVTLPTPAGLTAYELLWDSVWERPQAPQPAALAGRSFPVTAASMRIYRVVAST